VFDAYAVENVIAEFWSIVTMMVPVCGAETESAVIAGPVNVKASASSVHPIDTVNELLTPSICVLRA